MSSMYNVLFKIYYFKRLTYFHFLVFFRGFLKNPKMIL